jgi:hypothetical protein
MSSTSLDRMEMGRSSTAHTDTDRVKVHSHSLDRKRENEGVCRVIDARCVFMSLGQYKYCVFWMLVALGGEGGKEYQCVRTKGQGGQSHRPSCVTS